METTEKQQLIELIAERFEACMHKLMQYALHLTIPNSDLAQDLLNETYLRLIEKADRYNPRKSLLPYAKRTMHNIYINRYVRNKVAEVPLSAFSDSYQFSFDRHASLDERFYDECITPSERRQIARLQYNQLDMSLIKRIRKRYEHRMQVLTEPVRFGGVYDLAVCSVEELADYIDSDRLNMERVMEIVEELKQGACGVEYVVRATVYDCDSMQIHNPELVYALLMLKQQRYPIPRFKNYRVPIVLYYNF